MGDEKFLKSVYIVDRGVLTPYFMKTHTILPASSFSNFLHPSPHFPVTSQGLIQAASNIGILILGTRIWDAKFNLK